MFFGSQTTPGCATSSVEFFNVSSIELWMINKAVPFVSPSIAETTSRKCAM